MKALGEILKLSTKYLDDQKISRARRDAEEIIAAVLGKKRIDLYLEFDRPMQESELEKIRVLMKRRAKGEPLQYILGSVEFFGCRLQISSDVLIPRQETEILLYKACQFLEKFDLTDKVAWDICSGSGCLGIALKKKFPALRVSLSDYSSKALQIAKKNAEENGVEVEILEGDLLKPFSGKKADFIFCNPPYITLGEYELLEKEVKDFEPRMALVGGVSGLEYYERLAKELPEYIKPGAKIFFEIGKDQGKSIIEIFSSPFWKTKVVEKDWSGHNRFFFLEIE